MYIYAYTYTHTHTYTYTHTYTDTYTRTHIRTPGFDCDLNGNDSGDDYRDCLFFSDDDDVNHDNDNSDGDSYIE